MKIAIYSRGLEGEAVKELHVLLTLLKQHKASILLFQSLTGPGYKHMLKSFDYEIFAGHTDLPANTDCLISLGGDGTMLDCATLIRSKGIPLLGINFGRLGFLATIGTELMQDAVEAIMAENFISDKRTMLHLESDTPLFGDAPFALNEVVVHKRDTSSMIKIHAYLNGEFLNTYWCDGVIVSTPTGSTGYNLSCNGPIVFPDSSNFVITPIAPHNLNVRPLVVPDSNVISFEVEGRSDHYICSMDARRELVKMNTQIAIRKESFDMSLVRLSENTFLETLRSKLTWGLDVRN